MFRHWSGCPTDSASSHLISSHLIHLGLGGAQTQYSATQSGTHACPAWSPPRRSTKAVRVARVLSASRRKAPVPGEPLPEICNPTLQVQRGVLFEDTDDLTRSRGPGARSRASSRPARWRKRRTANQATKGCHCLCQSQHEWFLDGGITGCACWQTILCVETGSRKSHILSEEL